MTASCDQHVVTSLQNEAHHPIGPEQNIYDSTLINIPSRTLFMKAAFVTYFHAATDVIPAIIAVLLIFPPKAPPILFT